jgi:hypothetical protein
MPLLREGLMRRAWRRAVVAEFVERLDEEGDLFLVGSGPGDRREMLRVAEMLPEDVVAELYEDPWYPGYTFMELRLLPAPVQYSAPPLYSDPWDRRERAV